MRIQSIFLAVAVIWAVPVAAQDQAAVEAQYGRAVHSAEQGELAAAIATMDSVLAVYPDVPNALWNLGLWHSELQQHQEALAAWKAYRKVVPKDWHVRAKLIQAYQALADMPSRDREREGLLELRRAGTDTTLARFDMYCREQFRTGQYVVMAFETFEPAGDRRVFFTFYVSDSTGQELGHYSLGSYDFTTQVARETGDIGPDERIYHVDWYGEGEHGTLGFFRQLIAYEAVRQLIVESLNGERNPVSGSRLR